MFPALSGGEASLLADTVRPVPWTYRFDWTTRQLRQGPDGRFLRTETYAEYLEEIAKKLLNTRRFRYAIYTERIGVDFLSEIGRLQSGISLAVIRAQAEEALEAHSEIERAQVRDIQVDGKRITFFLELTGSRGSTRTEVDAWQR